MQQMKATMFRPRLSLDAMIGSIQAIVPLMCSLPSFPIDDQEGRRWFRGPSVRHLMSCHPIQEVDFAAQNDTKK